MDEQFEMRRAAVGALVHAVLDHLVSDEGQPRIGRMIDNWRWWRHGQEDFIGLQPRAWHMPDYVAAYGWLDRLPEMAAVRERYSDHPVLRRRVDSTIGVEFRRQGRQFAWLLIEHVIQPLILTTATYDFDKARFDRVYQDFERGLGATHVHMVEFLPLNGFESNEDVIHLPDDVVLQRMSDAQMSAALNQLAVPRMPGGGVNGARVSRFGECACWRLGSPSRR